RSYRRATGRRGLRSPVEAVGRNRRLSGGLVAHLGVAVLAISVTTSSTFAKQTEVTLAKGQATTFAGYTIRYDGERLVRQPQRVVEIAETTVTRGGRAIGSLDPSLNLYPSASEPIGTPSIDYGVLKDLYSSVLGFDTTGA